MLIHNAEVTGSLKINNVPFNSGSFSGSFRGDGSQLSGVTGATTASYVEYSNVGNKPALVSGSSQITYSGLSGIPSGIVSSSTQITGYNIFATTGSNIFQGNQTITGSLFVAQNLIVAGSSSIQYISSSVVDIADNIITVNAFNPGVRFGGLAVADSGSSPRVSGSLLFDSIKDQWIFIHENSSVITSSVLLMGPETYNDLGNESYISANRLPKGSGIEHLRDSNITDTGTVVSVNSNTAVTGSFTVVTGSAVELQVTNTGVNIGSVLTDSHIISGSLRVNPNGLFVSGSGNVGIGTDNPSQKLEVVGGEIKAGRVDSSNEGGQVSFGRASDNATGWYIDVFGSTSTPALRFVDVSNSAVRMAINSSGNVGIGTDSPNDLIEIKSSTANQANYRLYNTFNDGANNYGINWFRNYDSATNSQGAFINYVRTGGSSGDLSFGTGTVGAIAERVRITNDNNVLFNTTSTSTSNTSSFIFRSGTGAYSGVMIMNHATTNNTGAGFMDCYYNTSYIGGIVQNGASNVSFATSSDYRLKQDLKDFNGLNLISNLKVYDFKWKTEDSRMHGVIAHELQEQNGRKVTKIE